MSEVEASQEAAVEETVAPEIAESTAALEAQAAEAEAATETPEVEPKVEPKAETAEQDKRFAAKFAALNRREKQIKQREREADQRLAQIEQQMAELAAKKEQKPEEVPLELRLKKDPLNTLKELGLSYDTLTQMALNDGKLTPELQMELREKELERRFEEKYGSKITAYEKQIEAERQQAEKAREAQAVSRFKTDIGQVIEANKESLEVLAAEGAEGIDLVFDVMDAHYTETGKILDKKEAAELVEAELLAELEKRLTLKKVQTKVGAQTPATAKPSAKKPSPTLTNGQMQASQGNARYKSDDESKREAAKLIKWTED